MRAGRLGHIADAMFQLTRQEQLIVAGLVAVLLLGTIVKGWRARQAVMPAAPEVNEGYGKKQLR